jgi:predicted site-specific integrase-resolvase
MTHAQRISEEWITADQVMQILKISIRTLETLKKSGKLPYSKINGLVYFRTVDLENLLNQTYTNRASKNNDYVFKTKLP